MACLAGDETQLPLGVRRGGLRGGGLGGGWRVKDAEGARVRALRCVWGQRLVSGKPSRMIAAAMVLTSPKGRNDESPWIVQGEDACTNTTQQGAGKHRHHPQRQHVVHFDALSTRFGLLPIIPHNVDDNVGW